MQENQGSRPTKEWEPLENNPQEQKKDPQAVFQTLFVRPDSGQKDE